MFLYISFYNFLYWKVPKLLEIYEIMDSIQYDVQNFYSSRIGVVSSTSTSIILIQYWYGMHVEVSEFLRHSLEIETSNCYSPLDGDFVLFCFFCFFFFPLIYSYVFIVDL